MSASPSRRISLEQELREIAAERAARRGPTDFDLQSGRALRDERQPDRGLSESPRKLLARRLPAHTRDDVLYQERGVDVVRHVFRVASSLDSLVVGEPQILGQVKEAFDAAKGAGTMGTLLGRCFTQAFATAKRVRSETGIAEGTVSVSSIACELAKKIFGNLEGRRDPLARRGRDGRVRGTKPPANRHHTSTSSTAAKTVRARSRSRAAAAPSPTSDSARSSPTPMSSLHPPPARSSF